MFVDEFGNVSMKGRTAVLGGWDIQSRRHVSCECLGIKVGLRRWGQCRPLSFGSSWVFFCGKEMAPLANQITELLLSESLFFFF